MFDVKVKWGLFGFGKPRYYLVFWNRTGYSIISEYPTLDEAAAVMDSLNKSPRSPK